MTEQPLKPSDLESFLAEYNSTRNAFFHALSSTLATTAQSQAEPVDFIKQFRAHAVDAANAARLNSELQSGGDLRDATVLTLNAIASEAESLLKPRR
ncbi:hypothetical protein ACFPOB_26255 [Bosea eneae]|uniref:Phasin protein n=1 Tax=Bosea eneae TaxID=151454 RepID=A0ABW0IY89_9HYPH